MQGFAVLTLFLGYVSALPVYKAPQKYGGNTAQNYGVANGAGGPRGNEAIIPGRRGKGQWGAGLDREVETSSFSEGGEGEGGENGNSNGGFISSSQSSHVSTGGSAAPTLGPGGDPTTPWSGALPLNRKAKGVKAAGILLALGLVVGICIGIGVYLVKKNA